MNLCEKCRIGWLYDALLELPHHRFGLLTPDPCRTLYLTHVEPCNHNLTARREKASGLEQLRAKYQSGLSQAAPEP